MHQHSNDACSRPARLRAVLSTALGFIFAIVSTLGLVATPTQAQAVSGSTDVDAIIADTQQFVVADANGTQRFNLDAAVAAAASDDVLLAGLAFNDMMRNDPLASAALTNSTDEAMSRVSDGLPIWGNWCGPGHGSGEVTDTLDGICMRHDNCYDQQGYLDCDCDDQLIREINALSWQMTSGERAMAAAVKMYFSIGFCNPF